MPASIRSIGLAALAGLLLSVPALAADDLLVIAHRGACGYLPEHTLPAKALAYGMGADYIEQDCVLTKDYIPIVLHDIHLDTVTDVAEVYPDRAREDGRYYAIDFTLEEIAALRVHERTELGTGQAAFPDRFPLGESHFHVHTLAEEIELIQGLNHSTGRNVGIYPEIKSPAWHRAEGADISTVVLEVLGRYGYDSADDKCFVQCFDAAETRRLREELGTELPLVQLIGENDWDEAPTDFEALRTPAGLAVVAEYADGIGPWMPHVVAIDAEGRPQVTNLVDQAHQLGLIVHPYTFRADALPACAPSFDALLEIFITQAHVDGVFTDFPDRTVTAARSFGSSEP